jgi:hypothetical protein
MSDAMKRLAGCRIPRHDGADAVVLCVRAGLGVQT